MANLVFYEPQIAKKLCSVIGDNCLIELGAKIFRPVIVINNCSIGANAVMTKSCSIEKLSFSRYTS